MKKNIFLILFSLIIFSSSSFAQLYGNEWINFSLKYSKITISEEGLFKINFDAISAKGFQSGNLNPANFQLFNKGVEIPLLITGAQDGVFNQGDLIYFYGNKNDASLDKILYNKQTDLPNDQVSLFTDENYYFLTYNPSKNGLRYIENNLSTTSLTPEQYIVTKERLNFASNYYPGEYILDAMSLSEYTEGEGYLGASISKGQSVNYALYTSEFITTPSYQPQLSAYVAGRSNASSTNGAGNNHHFRISLGTTTLFDSLYRGYTTIRKTIPINIYNSSSSITISSIDDLGATTDFQALGYLELSYSRSFNLNGLKNLSFSFDKVKALTLLNFTNSGITTPIILEKNGSNLYTPSTSSGLQFVLSNTSTSKNYYLADQTLAKDIILNDVAFKNINSSTSNNYLIISHNSLNTGATAYKQYNQSIGMPTSLVLTDDLYNEFYYGFHHSMALRNYCKFMLEKGVTKPEYLLLLGKGFEISKENLLGDLVPTMGFPASDNMITSGLNGSNLEPGLATGRIPVRTNEEINNYLNKVKTYRQIAIFPWRKNILQVTGGKTLSEVSSFGNYQDDFYNKSKSEFFGAARTQVYKNVITPITENQTERIIKETRDGVALLSYFGHGSATGTEIAFGKPSDQQNSDKPTVYLVNGCSTGACFNSGNSLGEDFVLVKNVGAIIWIGTTSEGVASYLGNASSNYHKNWFNKFYGSSIAKGFKEGLRDFQNTNDKLNKAHVCQYIFLGDPSLKFYAPNKSDYNVTNSSLFLKTSNQNATSPILELTLKIENLGKALNDSLNLKIDRILPDNSIISIPSYKIKPIFNSDSININLNNLGLNVSGNNKITITLDPENKFDELNELNNQASLDLFLPGNGVRAIFPIKNGIVQKNTIILKAQPDDLHTKNAEYLFEIDTVADFTSLFKKSSPIIQANIFPQWDPNLILEKNKLYFWRAKLNLPADKGGSWSNSSFTYIPEIADGFSQSNSTQLDKIKLNNIDFDMKTGKFEFKKTYFSTSIYTEGDEGPDRSKKRFRTTQAIDWGSPNFEGLTLIAMSNLTPNSFFSYPSPYNSTYGPVLVNGYTGQYFWNINDPIQVDSLIRFINQIPAGYNIIGFNGINAEINKLNSEAKNALKSFGLIKYDLINKGEPYMFWGKKGIPQGNALEFTADYNSSVSPRAQSLQYFNDLPYSLSNGTIETELIGPSKEWHNINIEYLKNSSDQIKYSIIGINKLGNEQILLDNISQTKFSISDIVAQDFPFLKIKSTITDIKEFTVPYLKHFIVDYKPISELSINPDYSDIFYSKKINEGDSLKWQIGLTNISVYPTDSISVNYSLIRPNNIIQIKSFPKLAGLQPKESIILKIKEPTNGYVGKNSLKLNLNPNLNDLYVFNNNMSNDYEIIGDKQEPLLSILFDGRAIINGEIISPKPLISIKTVDENKFLLLKDTSTVEIFVKKESDANFQRISYSNKTLKFNPATSGSNNSSIIEYSPEFIQDGTYSLKVKSKDVTGNFTANDFMIDFEVINESTLTNFYPYPNPVVNSMRFIFTLTGLKIPDKIKIVIYTASGKIIRTISKEDLGNLKIGNNISDFNWDGTDEFGDRLANGIYFYKVDIEDSSDYKLKRTKGDTNFKNRIGKIYLLR